MLTKKQARQHGKLQAKAFIALLDALKHLNDLEKEHGSLFGIFERDRRVLRNAIDALNSREG